MAKRELSSTLKNLKFMQRASPKEEGEIQEPGGSVFAAGTSNSAASRRCIVIFEGDPHPGALRGRISFQNFNPSIDKLNEEAATIHQNSTSIPPKENGNISNRSEKSKASDQENRLDADLKRKPPLEETETPDPNKVQKSGTPGSNIRSPSHRPNRSSNQNKREKTDWNLLRRQ